MLPKGEHRKEKGSLFGGQVRKKILDVEGLKFLVE